MCFGVFVLIYLVLFMLSKKYVGTILYLLHHSKLKCVSNNQSILCQSVENTLHAVVFHRYLKAVGSSVRHVGQASEPVSDLVYF